MNSPSALSPAKIPPRLKSICEHLASQSSKTSLSKYLDLYTEIYQTIPRAILSRSPHYMTQRELVIVMDGKLAFGINRPALRGMIAKLTEESVVEASKRAFQILPQKVHSTSADDIDPFKHAMKTLCILRGVGPATASLVLSLISSDVPFFSDEAAVSIIKPRDGRKGLKYSESEYWAYFKRVQEECLKAGGEIKPRDWERTTWANAVLEENKDGVNVRKRPSKDAVEDKINHDSSSNVDDDSLKRRKKAKQSSSSYLENNIKNSSEEINESESSEQSRKPVDSQPKPRRSVRRQ